MGKLTNAISAVIEGADARPEKIAKRLIEAGLNLMCDQGAINAQSRIVPEIDEDDTDYDGSFHIATRSALPEMQPIELPTFTQGYVQGGPNQELIPVERVPEMLAAIRMAGNLFDDYARQHFDKQPPQINKANRNVEAAVKLFMSIGDDYEPPVMPGPASQALMAAKPGESGARSPVESDLGLSGVDGASTLLWFIHEGTEAGKPVKGIELHPDQLGILNTLVDLGLASRDDVSDDLGITIAGREKIGLRPEGVPVLPVTLAEVTGNVEERELAGRYIDAKIQGVDRWLRENPGSSSTGDYTIIGFVLREIAHEFRSGMHLPALVIEGRIIPYNETRDTGIRHADALRLFFEDVHGRNVKAGWWSDINTGEPKKRNVGELLMLFVTEIAEAYEAYYNRSADDKLSQYPGFGVELADLGIRWADLCGAYLAGRVVECSDVDNPGEAIFRDVLTLAHHYEAIRKTPEAIGSPELGTFMEIGDVATMTDAKLDFNATRQDHKIENRLKDDGKKT